jgi:hypothetical protein
MSDDMIKQEDLAAAERHIAMCDRNIANQRAIIGGLLLRDTKDVDIEVGSGVEAAHHA